MYAATACNKKNKKHDWQTDFPIPASPTAGNAEGIWVRARWAGRGEGRLCFLKPIRQENQKNQTTVIQENVTVEVKQ